MTDDHDLDPPYGFTDGQVTYRCETCYVRVSSLFTEEHEEWHESQYSKLSRRVTELEDINDAREAARESARKGRTSTYDKADDPWPPPIKVDPDAFENNRHGTRTQLLPPADWRIPPASDWNKLPAPTMPSSQAFIQKLNDPASAPDKQWLRERPAVMYDDIHPPKPAERKIDLVAEMVAFIEDAGVPVNEYVLVNEMMKAFGFTRKTVAQALFEAMSWDKPFRLVRVDKELVYLPAPELPDAVKEWKPPFSV